VLRPVVGDDDFVSLVLLKAFCYRVLNVGGLFECGVFFPKTFATWCNTLIKLTNKKLVGICYL
jgi:hypothetical protein